MSVRRCGAGGCWAAGSVGRRPHRSRPSRHETTSEAAEERGVRTGGGEGDAHAAGGLDHPPRDLEQMQPERSELGTGQLVRDRKSTRLNSSHANISYAVFCLKKK